ncbi:hypothetical protein HQ325_10660 [Rhodococcus sp. BP-349]|nr:hypothetical protein [Rhodococcus sp. BP-363]MBY6544538.1 hypothetical protein [Rhodococcus sp. BP-369]MBY6563768.1 hypothetical protein [Rhodococcus sp. BP-370]MBY6578060.1 hypothetical protein [Rhodococcus sp. BP-364]MBY6587361.1 hypothetical protein [Rhodococcus sp. BP-358]MBY6591698.1 hypothetical protein [Rhodococcus sp. BP-362]MBY6594968.1 hypothetical protein [Rhodococcus sp. BP-359]MBY6599307.1 hypothetical protein [Rhodococcus sp. BP-353]MBY6603644.1 hypothetical protein [Rhodoc
MNALFAASAWCLAGPNVWSISAVVLASIGWLLFNGPLEGRVLVVFSPQHGFTESDVLSIVGMIIGAVGVVRARRRADRRDVPRRQ